MEDERFGLFLKCRKGEEGADLGRMMTGAQMVDGGSETQHYYFQDNGKAYWNTIVNGYLYGSNGFRVESSSDDYELIYITGDQTVSEEGSGKKYRDCTFAVIPSGKLKKSGTIND